MVVTYAKLNKQGYFKKSAEILRVFLAECKLEKLKYEKYTNELEK